MTEQSEQLATIPTEDAGQAEPNGPGDLDIVKIYNEELDSYGESPRAGVALLAGWEVVDPTPEEAQLVTSFDPSTHSVGEVTTKLAESSEAERDAIIALEKDGKKRSTVLKWEPDSGEQTPSDES